MKHYNDYINDPYFLKWIFQPESLSEQYWTKYIESHPDEKKQILLLKEELSYLKLKNEDLSEQEKKLLLQKILKKKNQIQLGSNLRINGIRFARYAAVAAVFLVLGNVLMYLYLNKAENQINYADLEYNLPVEKPLLVLPDGSNIELAKNSNLKYTKGNQLIVDGQAVDIKTKNLQVPVSNQVIIPSGTRSTVTLSDKTVVYLNAGSKLIYPSEFTGNEREVLLFGEAFFEVSKNKSKPFIVKTAALSVKVLGTKFNISAYSEDNDIQTVLVEGMVSVKRNDASFFDRSITLEPNQMVRYDKQSKELITAKVDPEYYTLWKDGMLKFENEELSSIIHKIERFYNLTITLKDPTKGNIQMSGKLNLSENEYEVFEYLTTITKMEFEKINEKYFVLK